MYDSIFVEDSSETRVYASGIRRDFNDSQLRALEMVFAKSPMPPSSVMQALASRIGVTHQRVKSWFATRRKNLHLTVKKNPNTCELHNTIEFMYKFNSLSIL